MRWLRRFFPDPNELIPCTDCGALTLRRTAKETGGFCAPCSKMTPDSRAARRAFNHHVETGAQFRLSPDERASAQPLTIPLPPPHQWQAHAEDVPHIAGKTVATVLAAAENGAPSVHLRGPDDLYLSLEQSGDLAILTTYRADTPDIRFAHGPMAATGQIPKGAQLWLSCPCCGQGSVTAPSKFHLPRDAALAALRHILAGTAPAHLRWITADDFTRVTTGHG